MVLKILSVSSSDWLSAFCYLFNQSTVSQNIFRLESHLYNPISLRSFSTSFTGHSQILVGIVSIDDAGKTKIQSPYSTLPLTLANCNESR